MTQKPLDILKKGLSELSRSIKKKRDDLCAKLSRQEVLSSAEEQWLDREGNTVDEQRLLDTLESASDYEKGVAQLDDNGQAIVKRLRELAGDLPNKVAGKKRKRTHSFPKLGVPLMTYTCIGPIHTPNVKSTPIKEAPVFTKKENASVAQ